MAHDDFIERFPLLDDPAWTRGPGACIDLHVNGTANGTLTDTNLGGTALVDVLRASGLTAAAARTEQLSALSPDDALKSIAATLAELFPSPTNN